MSVEQKLDTLIGLISRMIDNQGSFVDPELTAAPSHDGVPVNQKSLELSRKVEKMCSEWDKIDEVFRFEFAVPSLIAPSGPGTRAVPRDEFRNALGVDDLPVLKAAAAMSGIQPLMKTSAESRLDAALDRVKTKIDAIARTYEVENYPVQ